MVLRLLSFIFIVTLVAYIEYIPTSISLPFIVIHGIGQKCTNQKIVEFTKQLSEWSAAEGYCIEGNGGFRSWLLPLQDQVTDACSKVKQMKELNKGFHIVGLSQGTLIARGIIEFCDGVPPVKNFISLAGPHAGTASAPSYPTKLYVDDWIGLKALDDAGKVKYVSVPGNHLAMSQDDMKKYIVPYLKDSKIVQQNYRSGTLLETQTDDNRYCSNDLSAVLLKSKQNHDISY